MPKRENLEEVEWMKGKAVVQTRNEVLIKVIAQAIPTYMMSIFRIPDGLIDEIQALIAKFWWGLEWIRKEATLA